MSTPLSDWYETLRVLTDDARAVQLRSDAVLLKGLRSAVKLNKLPGYTLDTDLVSVTPEVTDPNIFALLAYHTTVLFLLPKVRAYAYKRRAQGESFGHQLVFLDRLDSEIHTLENSQLFRGWQTYVDYFEGKVGLPEAGKMTHTITSAPWGTVGV